MMQNFIFGPGTDWTYEQLQRKRAIAEKLAESVGKPTTLGGGLSALGAGFGAGILSNKSDKQEKRISDEANSAFDAILASLGVDGTGGGGFGFSGASGYGGSPAYAQPDPLAPQAIADDAMRALEKPLVSPNIEYDPNNPEKLAADTMAMLGKEPSYIKYDNAGATRNQPLSPELIQALSFLPEIGVEGRVVSGGQHAIGTGGPRTGSTRHDLGGAGDMDFYKDGRRLSTDNPEDMPVFREIARRGVGAGLTGMGEGADYMGSGRMHLGYGAPATWGAGGDTANTPSWLGQAYAQGVSDYGNPTPVRTASNERFSAANNPLVDTARQIAAEEGVPEDLFLGLVQQESSWNPNARSNAGAIGLAQLMPGTAQELGVNPNDPVENLRGGARYLKQQLDRFGTPELALAAYNAGPSRVEQAGGIPNISETQNYVQRITGNLGAAPQVSGGQRVAQNAPNMALVTQLAAAANNPALDPGKRAIAGMLLQQQMTQMTPTKPDYQWNDDLGQYVDLNDPNIGNLRAPEGGANEPTEYGLTPQYIVKDDGTLQMLQLAKDGTSKVVDLPEGAAVAKGVEKLDLGTSYQWYNTITGEPIGQPIPKNVREEAAESAGGAVEGKAEAEAGIALPRIEAQTGQAIALIEDIINDPALPSITGMLQGRMPPATQAGTDLYVKIKQLQGKVFMEAYESLKGGGVITEVEGAKAEAAIARLERAQSDESYVEALRELQGIMQTGVDRARQKAGTAGQPQSSPAETPDWMLNTNPMEWTPEQMDEAERIWGLK